jgi:predicted permease
MSRFEGVRRLFRLPATAASVDRDVDEEIDFHLRARADELIARGMSPVDAHAAALREFGDPAAARHELAAIDRRRVGRERRVEWWDALGQDVRFATRTLARSRGFTAAAVLTLALAIGTASAIFSVVDGVLLRPLPYPNQARVVLLWTTGRFSGVAQNELPFSAANFADVRDRTRAFEAVAAFRDWSFTIADGPEPELVPGARVSPALFEILGVRPMLGRALRAEDDHAGAAKVAVIGHALWQRHFGGDRQVVGRQATLNGERYTVVGVMPRGFQFPRGAELPSGFQFAPRTELWAPLAYSAERAQNRGTLDLAVVGLLPRSVTVQQARDDLSAVMRRIGEENDARELGLGGAVVPMREHSVRSVRSGLFLLLGAVAILLLIACANVASLLVVRTTGRQREMAIRAALGAGRRRLARQLVTETMLLAAVGGALGIGLAAWAKTALLSRIPGTLPRLDDVVVDGRVLAVMTVVALAAGIGFGMVSAAHVARRGLGTAMRDGARGAGGVPRNRTRQALVVGEVALSIMLLVGAALLVQSFVRMQRVLPGFEPSGALTARLVVPPTAQLSYAAEGSRWSAVYTQYLDRVRGLPGVTAAGAVSSLPLSGAWESTDLRIEGRPAPSQDQRPSAQYAFVSPDYFAAMRIPLRTGRGFGAQDRKDAPGVVIVSERAAERYWPGESPVGQRIRVFTDEPLEVVGVVGDVRQTSLTDPIQPTVYIPLAQFPVPGVSLVVRASGDPAALVPALRRELRAVDPGVPLTEARTLRAVFDESLAQRRFSMLLIGFFAASAVALAAVGLYSVIAHGVTQRAHELGIRMALGALPGQVLRLVVRQALVLAAVGVVLGTLGALAATSLIRSQLYEVSPADPVTYAAIAAAVLGVALLASLLPARRATRIDPMTAMRVD